MGFFSVCFFFYPTYVKWGQPHHIDPDERENCLKQCRKWGFRQSLNLYYAIDFMLDETLASALFDVQRT